MLFLFRFIRLYRSLLYYAAFALALLCFVTPVYAGVEKIVIDENCQGMDGLLADIKTLDHSIQRKLAAIYEGDACYIGAASKTSRPLTDDIVGPVTKRWINQALMERDSYLDLYLNNCPQAESCDLALPTAVLPNADDGVRPYVILEDDLLYLRINHIVIEKLRALAEDTEKNSFVTEQEALSAIVNELSAIEGMNDTLLEKYKEAVKPMIKRRHMSVVQQRTLNALVAAGLVEEANILTQLLDKSIDYEEFGDVLYNTLKNAEKQKQQVFLDKIREEFKEEEKQQVEKAEKAEEEVDTEFKEKLDEIVELASKPKTTLQKFKKLAGKIVALFKKEKKVEEDKQEEIEKPSEEEAMALMERIFQRKIAQHEKKLEKLIPKRGIEKANNEEKAAIDNENYIINELKKVYVNEKDRLEKKVALEKEKKEEERQAAIKLKEREEEKKRRESEAPNLDITNATLVVNDTFLLKPRYYFLPATFPKGKVNDDSKPDNLEAIFPSIDEAIFQCARNMQNYIYPSINTLESAVSNMLVQMDKVSWNIANPNNEKYIGFFDCELDKAEIEDYFSKHSGAKEILLQVGRQPFLRSDLDPIDVDIFPNCPQCSLPMKGTTYGFYPYWQASTLYRDEGLSLVNPTQIDFSVFSRMAYYAIPIDNDGSILDEMHWRGNARGMHSFVETMSRYNVARDIIFYSKNWCHWGNVKKSEAGDIGQVCPQQGQKKPSMDVRDAIYTYAEKHYALLVEKHNAVKEQGGLSGVTFYFDDYTNKIDVQNIIDYVTHFNQQIEFAKKNGDNVPQFEISIILGIKGLKDEFLNVSQKIKEDDPNYFIKLKRLFLSEDHDQETSVSLDDIENQVQDKITTFFGGQSQESPGPLVKRILVFMEENTSYYKKRLRMQIENEFSGSKRVDALLAVVPVITREYQGEESSKPYRQFLDDITYLKYNFGGIGLWSLPFPPYFKDGKQEALAVDKETESPSLHSEKMKLFSHVIKKNFADTERNYIDYNSLGPIGQVLYHPMVVNIFDVCGEVCPKRDIYMNTFIVLLVFTLLVEFLWRTNCRVRVILKAIHPAYAITKLSLLTLFFILLGCLPEWQTSWGRIIIIPVIIAVLSILYRLFSRVYEEE